MSKPLAAVLALVCIGCNETASTPDVAEIDLTPKPVHSNTTDNELRASLLWSRFPDDKQGYWLTGNDAESAVSVDGLSVQPVEPIPDIGYVPLNCEGHTLAGIVRNKTQMLVADVELTVTAVDKKSGALLAEMDTTTMIPYHLTEPDRSEHREVLLTNRFDQGSSPFDAMVNWAPFSIKAKVRRVRVIEQDAHLSYIRNLESEAAAHREAHKDDQGPHLYD